MKESNVIETSSDDDDFYMLFWVVCWSKQERSVHTEPHTRPSSRVLCSGGSRDWIADPTIDKCDPKSLHNTLSPRSYSSPSSYYRTKRSSPTHIPTLHSIMNFAHFVTDQLRDLHRIQVPQLDAAIGRRRSKRSTSNSNASPTCLSWKPCRKARIRRGRGTSDAAESRCSSISRCTRCPSCCRR